MDQCLQRQLRRLATLVLLGAATTAEVGAKEGSPGLASRLVDAAKAEVAARIPVPKGGTLSIALAPPDPRLNLAPCPGKLATKMLQAPAHGGAISVQVSCPGPTRWSLYLSGTASVRAPVATARVGLARGALVAADDLEMRMAELSTLAGGFALAKAELIGRRLRQPVAKGNPIAPRATAPDLWVKTGEPIVLTAGQGALAVRMEGVSLSDGAENALVSVRNAVSRKILKGRVIAPGLVQLGP